MSKSPSVQLNTWRHPRMRLIGCVGCGWGRSESHPVREEDWVPAGWDKLPEEDSRWGENKIANVMNSNVLSFLHICPYFKSCQSPHVFVSADSPVPRNCVSYRNTSQPSRCMLTWMCPNRTWRPRWETSGSNMKPWLHPTCRRRRSGTGPRSGQSSVFRSSSFQEADLPIRRHTYFTSLCAVFWLDGCSQSECRSAASGQTGGQWLPASDPSAELRSRGSARGSESHLSLIPSSLEKDYSSHGSISCVVTVRGTQIYVR